jgi:hypothetical protein
MGLAAGICLVGTTNAWGQGKNEDLRFVQVSMGLGVGAHSAPSLVDYISTTSGQRLNDFASASEFFLTPEVQVTDDLSLAVEYSYLIKSYNVDPAWEFSYAVQMPSLLVHYLLPGEGYWLKFGGGVGYASGTFTERYSVSGAEASYDASGFSLKAEAVGNTRFDEHFWGSIGLDLRWVFGGTFKETTQSYLVPPRLRFFSAGVKFGVLFQL